MTKNHPPVIGITADYAEGIAKAKSEPTLFLAQRYYRAVEQSGATPLVLPPLSSNSVVTWLHLSWIPRSAQRVPPRSLENG